MIVIIKCKPFEFRHKQEHYYYNEITFNFLVYRIEIELKKY